jgi:hypothetical protein
LHVLVRIGIGKVVLPITDMLSGLPVNSQVTAEYVTVFRGPSRNCDGSKTVAKAAATTKRGSDRLAGR